MAGHNLHQHKKEGLTDSALAAVGFVPARPFQRNVDARKQGCAIPDVFALRGRAIPDARERLLTVFQFPPVP